MAIEDQLLDEIQSTLGSAITPSLRRSDPSGVFEGYILSLILRAAVKVGARTPIQYRDVYGNTPTIFEFRISPGYIASRFRPYTHAIIEFPNKPVLEAHIGVLVEGQSGVLHECDVAVITKEEADRCRRESQSAWSKSPAIWVSPDTAKIVLAVECKFYLRSILGVNLARSFIGLTSDISSRCEKYFVASTSSQSVEILLNDKRKSWHSNILPNSIEMEMLQNAFQTNFRNFITSRKW